MTPEKLQSIAFKWIESCNSKELEKLLSLYDDDAQHFSPKLKTVQPEKLMVSLVVKTPYVLGGKMLLRKRLVYSTN